MSIKINIMVNGKIILNMAREFISLLMEMLTKGTLKMIKKMVKEFLLPNLLNITKFKELGKKTNFKVFVRKLKEILLIKETLKRM